MLMLITFGQAMFLHKDDIGLSVQHQISQPTPTVDVGRDYAEITAAALELSRAVWPSP